jgi:hypothetical protein
MNESYLSKNYYCKSPNKEKVYDKRKSDGSTLNINDIDTKILIYEDRVNGWFLDIANDLKKDGCAGFVILSIAISYIEGNQQFREGNSSERNSENFFIKGMLRIFNNSGLNESILKDIDIYDQVRCGLFHDGMARKSVHISGNYPKPITVLKMLLFSVNQEYQTELDEKKLLGKLRQEFTDNEITLSQNLIVSVKEIGTWQIKDENQIYTVKKEKDKLNIYNGIIRIRPDLFLDDIIKDFYDYIQDLKNTSKVDLRTKFESKWKTDVS